MRAFRWTLVTALQILLLSGCLNGTVTWTSTSPTGGNGLNGKSTNCTSAPLNLVSWWDGDAVQSLTSNDIQSSNNGAMSSSVTLTHGEVGNAYTLDGTDGSVSIPSATNLNFTNGMSIVGWVNGARPDRGSNTVQSILSKWSYETNISLMSNWSGVDITTTNGLNNANYSFYTGGVFDGRYIYFIPSGASTAGQVARYDTQAPLTGGAASWLGQNTYSFNTSFADYAGGVFDGRYVYFISYSSTSGWIVRYDTTSPFNSSSSWVGVDISSASVLNSTKYRNFNGAVFDGRYIYIVPFGKTYVARYDTTDPADFTNATAWAGVNIGTVNANFSGFLGGIFDGRYIYFIPETGLDTVARYDSQGAGGFTNTSNWVGVSTVSMLGSNYSGYSGAAFDGRYIYFAPYFGASTASSYVARLDTSQPANFTSPSAWTGYNIATPLGSSYGGFAAAYFDGRYVNFIPGFSSVSSGNIGDGYFARYDTTVGFQTSTSWSGVNVASSLGADYVGYTGAVSDGRYLYLIPEVDTGGYENGKLARFDLTDPAVLASYNLKYSDSVGDGIDGGAPGVSLTLNMASGNTLVVNSETTLTAGWHLVAATYDNTAARMYIDGAMMGMQLGTGNIQQSTANVTIGALTGGAGFFNGQLDEVQMYSSALNLTQIQTIYNAGSTGLCK